MFHIFNSEGLRGRVAGRKIWKTIGLAALLVIVAGAYAEILNPPPTPVQAAGPFFPDRLPADVDNDLVIINDNSTPAAGTISWLRGHVLDRRGNPVNGALVEIWQADNNGAYLHPASPVQNRDVNFQGYGSFLTRADGAYLFRTIRPGAEQGRARHVHFRVTIPGRPPFTTQLYVDGEPRNDRDPVLNQIHDSTERASVVRAWKRLPVSGELLAEFEIVVDFMLAPDRDLLLSE